MKRRHHTSNGRPRFQVAEYVHSFQDGKGLERFAVAAWDAGKGQYWAPLDRDARRRTGCFAEYSRTLSGMPHYPSRRQAERRARYLFHEMYALK